MINPEKMIKKWRFDRGAVFNDDVIEKILRSDKFLLNSWADAVGLTPEGILEGDFYKKSFYYFYQGYFVAKNKPV